jgi:ubiquitin
VATITPFVSTVNGVATTISAAPASLTATTTTSQSDSKPTETSVPSGGGSFQVCHNLDGHFAPMCKPDNGTAIYVGQTYYGRNLIGGLRSNCSNREQLHGTRRISQRRMPQSS